MSRKPYIILVLVLAVYALLVVLMAFGHLGGLMAYAMPSACWGLVALIALWISRPQKIREWFNKKVSIMAALIAALQVFIFIDAGIFMGFGKSPFSSTPRGIAINIIFVYTSLLGVELTRAYLIKNLSHKQTTLLVGLIALLYTFIPLPFTGLPTQPLTMALFVSSMLLPLAAESILASYLALLGGPIAALAYRAPLKAFSWFSPILPDLPWHIEALVGIVAPAIGFLIVAYITTPTLVSTTNSAHVRPSIPKTVNPKRDEKEQKQKKKTTRMMNKRLTALLFSVLIVLSICNVGFSHWTDSVEIGGTVMFGNPCFWIWKHGAKVWPDWQVGYYNDNQTLYARIINTGERSAYIKVEFIIYGPLGPESTTSNISLCDGIPPGNVTVSAEYHPPCPGTFYFQGILYYSFDTINWRPWYEVQDVLGGEGLSKTASSKFKVRT